MRRRQSDDDDVANASVAQRLLKTRANEGAVHILAEGRLAMLWRGKILKCVPRLGWMERRFRRTRIVLHMKDRPPARAPRREQKRDIGFGVRIVAFAPIRLVEPFLNVD